MMNVPQISLGSICIALTMLSGCSSSSDGGGDIAATPLAGKVGGQSWTFQAGLASSLSGEDDLLGVLYAEAFTPCTADEPSSSAHLFLAVPRQPGTYAFSPSRNITFAGTGDNDVFSLNGQIVVESVTATMVTGGVRSQYDDGNQVDGQFQLTICPGGSSALADLPER